MKRYLLALVASLSLAGCASSYTYDPAHSVAYNVVRAGGLRVDDSQALDSHPVAWQTGAVAGGHQGGGALTMGAETAVLAGGGVPALGVLNVLDLFSGPSPPPAEKLPQLFAWVPVALVNSGPNASSPFAVSVAETSAIYEGVSAVTEGANKLVVRIERNDDGDDFPVLAHQVCAPPQGTIISMKDGAKCNVYMPFGARTTSSAPVISPPAFVPVSGHVYDTNSHGFAPWNVPFLFQGPNSAFLNSIPMLTRISAHLPPWVFIYVPATRSSAAYVLQAGHRLEFGR